MMTVALLQGRLTFPLKEDVVLVVVDCSLDDSRMVVLENDGRLVTFWLRPVVGIVGVFTGRIGKPKGDCCPSVY
jgi:hypothetical protein